MINGIKLDNSSYNIGSRSPARYQSDTSRTHFGKVKCSVCSGSHCTNQCWRNRPANNYIYHSPQGPRRNQGYSQDAPNNGNNDARTFNDQRDNQSIRPHPNTTRAGKLIRPAVVRDQRNYSGPRQVEKEDYAWSNYAPYFSELRPDKSNVQASILETQARNIYPTRKTQKAINYNEPKDTTRTEHAHECKLISQSPNKEELTNQAYNWDIYDNNKSPNRNTPQPNLIIPEMHDNSTQTIEDATINVHTYNTDVIDVNRSKGYLSRTQ